jgi:hypothetical protein
MSTLKTTNLQNASAASPAFVLAADGSATANLSSVNGGPIAGSRNRIINGDMRIDQRNAGASVTSGFLVDRFQIYSTQSGKWTAQQSSTAPSGFTKSTLITSSSAYSPTSSDYFSFATRIEGNNIADLDWGSANAKTITVSFWVRSSLTGTWGGALHNNAFNRVYPFSYTISAANTWEQKTVTIAGDTTGTWLTDNSVGIEIGFAFSVGSSGLSTAGAWSATANIFSATGQTNLLGTNGATFYITGVQLEPGSTATPFERRSYGQELALCQRYFVSMDAREVTLIGGNSTRANGTVFFPCAMRNSPTLTGVTSNRLTNYGVLDYSGSYTFSAVNSLSTHATIAYIQSTGNTWAAGQPLAVTNSSGSVNISVTAEL